MLTWLSHNITQDIFYLYIQYYKIGEKNKQDLYIFIWKYFTVGKDIT